MASTTSIQRPQAVPHIKNRYLEVAKALQHMGYLVETKDNTNWVTVTGPDGLTCLMKVYDTPSKYGIEDGCISKISMWDGDDCLFHYDRGLDLDDLDQHLDSMEFFDVLMAVAN